MIAPYLHSRRVSTHVSPRVALLAALVLLALLASALRFWGIQSESLEGDEMFSHHVATAAPDVAMKMLHEDLVHPPLYYLIVRAFIAAQGTTAIAVRSFSLLSGIASVGLLVWIAYVFREMRVPALLGAVLLSVNNVHVFYSQQARSYSFYVLLVLLLLLWCWLMPRYSKARVFWASGTLLMIVLLYTHYVAAIYVACAVLSVTLGALPSQAKIRTWIAATVAALSFVPWLVAEYSVYLAKKGLGANLSWQQAPTLYDLKAIWASFTGFPDVRGATTAALLLGSATVVYGLLALRRASSFQRLALISLALTAIVPPILLFVLAVKPLSIPLFAPRHVLPSIVSWILLVSFGLWRLAGRTGRFRLPAFAAGSACLLALQLAPTGRSLLELPRRVPYASVAKDLPTDLPIYTTWPEGIGAPVNFYLNNTAHLSKLPATELPAQSSSFPGTILVLYRPVMPAEQHQMDRLIQEGWVVVDHKDYYSGTHSDYFVRVARLRAAATSLRT